VFIQPWRRCRPDGALKIVARDQNEDDGNASYDRAKALLIEGETSVEAGIAMITEEAAKSFRRRRYLEAVSLPSAMPESEGVDLPKPQVRVPGADQQKKSDSA